MSPGIKALWWKTYSDCKLLLGALTLLMLVFSWIFIWVMSQIRFEKVPDYLVEVAPEHFVRLIPMDLKLLGTSQGAVSLLYGDLTILMTLIVWSIARGSDVVSGELSRGTMEMLLSQPVSRLQVLGTQAAMTTLGSMIICFAVWFGMVLGIHTFTLPDPVYGIEFVAATTNLFAFAFCLAGLASAVSAADQYRSRTIGIIGGFVIIEFMTKVLLKMVEWGEHWTWTTIFTAFEPQKMIGYWSEVGSLTVQYNSILLGLGLLGYLVAAVIFVRRDLPAPL